MNLLTHSSLRSDALVARGCVSTPLVMVLDASRHSLPLGALDRTFTINPRTHHHGREDLAMSRSQQRATDNLAPIADVHTRPSTPLRVGHWLQVAAAHCVGSLLLGPHSEGAEAIIPPAVITRGVAGSEEEENDEFSVGGWRRAFWDRAEDDEKHINSRRPRQIEVIPFPRAVEIIAAEAPEHMEWLKRQVAVAGDVPSCAA